MALQASARVQAQAQLFDRMAAARIPRRYTHCMASFMPCDEWAYADELVQLAAGGSDDSEPHSCCNDSSASRQQLLVMPPWVRQLAQALEGSVLPLQLAQD